jgi:hypothetical protein
MDILSFAAIRIPCRQCGEPYSVPLSDILLSHKIMHQGCPVVQETECPPVFQSRLAPRSAIENLRRAWHRLQNRAEKDGGELVLIAAETNVAKSTTEADKKAAEGAAFKTGKKRKPRSRAA